jgi:hypothetical protein
MQSHRVATDVPGADRSDGFAGTGVTVGFVGALAGRLRTAPSAEHSTYWRMESADWREQCRVSADHHLDDQATQLRSWRQSVREAR